MSLREAVELGIVAAASLVAIVSALMLVSSRKTFYSIVWLAFVGAGTAILMAVLGFTYLAVFHFIIYIGATIAFLLFVMAAIGEEVRAGVKHSLPAAIAAVLVSLALTYPILSSTYLRGRDLTSILAGVDVWRLAAEEAFYTNWLVMLIVIVALVSILVEVVAVARKGGA